MKVGWKRKRKKYTFIVLSNRPELPVRRTGISRFMISLICIQILLLISAITWWQYSLHEESQQNINHLHQTLSTENEKYSDMVDQKEARIDQLQTDIVQVTEQSSQVQRKLRELLQLEQEITQILDQASSELVSYHVNELDSLASKENETWQGGESFSIGQKQWSSFIQDTNTVTHELQQDIDKLLSSLVALKSDLLDKIQSIRTNPDHWPARSRNLTSHYGIRRDPITGRAAFHSGIDISGKINDPVYSAADGIVKEIGSNNSKGKYIRIQHSDSVETLYMHLHRISVERGDSIEKGARIGSVGNTGRSTGPHLHYEIWVNQQSINPLSYY